MSLLNLPVLSSEVGLSAYVRRVQSFAVLSEEEEHSLAMKWYQDGDVDAAQKLVLSHMRLVVKIAYTFKGYGLPMMDLISEGSIGLMKAVKKFNPDMGCRLATYAVWWIKATIQDFVLKSWSVLRIGTSSLQKKLFFNLHKVKKTLSQSDETIENSTQGAIAERLGVSIGRVRDMERNMSSNSMSLQDKIFNDQGEESDELLDSIAAEEDVENTMLDMHDKSVVLKKLDSAMKTLSDREKEIILARRLNDEAATLESLSSAHGISRERVRQIEKAALSKLKKIMLKNEQIVI